MSEAKTSTPRHRVAALPTGIEVLLALAPGGYAGQGRKAGAVAGAPADSPPLLEGWGKTMDWNGRTSSRRCARSPISETKLALLGVMHAFGKPMTADELHQVWGETKSPLVLDYHLRTLVELEIVKKVAVGSKSAFARVGSDIPASDDLAGSGAVSAYGFQAH